MAQHGTISNGRCPIDESKQLVYSEIPEWEQLWSVCVRRFRCWGTPPRWSDRDWWEEIEAQGLAAAWEALQAFDPARGVPLGAFLYCRIVAVVYTRYRQEWSYAIHCGIEPQLEVAVASQDASESQLQCRGWEALQNALTHLADADRWLIQQLYWDSETEARIASALGISQPAVNKRKHAVLRSLRAFLDRIGE